MTRSMILAGLLVLALSESVSAQATTGDPMVGLWKLNVARSTFSPGPAPKSEMYRYENLPDGFTRWTAITETAAGGLGFSISLRKYDGREYPNYGVATMTNFLATGAKTNTSQASRLIDAYTTELINRTDGKVMTTVTRTMARDGKSFTLRNTGINAAGEQVNVVAVYEKVDVPPT